MHRDKREKLTSNYIVCTTINAPTEAIDLYDAMVGWTLVVVGDLKTPKDYKLKNGIYLSPDNQKKFSPALSDLLGWNCIQRRNIGFLYALSRGAQIVATVDDDNTPLDNWGDNVLAGSSVRVKKYSSSDGLFDPMAVTNYPQLWHRGFPIQFLTTRAYPIFNEVEEIFDVEASFWNGDPDIDAICRMEHEPDCNFDKTCFPFASNGLSPFNSQNTFLTAETLTDYFMFPGVGRMDDIWGAYQLLSIGKKVIYTEPSVIQKRNPHDLTNDFEKEIPGYLNNYKILDRLMQSENVIKDYVPKDSWTAFQMYRSLAKGY